MCRKCRKDLCSKPVANFSLVFGFTLHYYQPEDPYVRNKRMPQSGQLLSPSLDRVEHEQKTSNHSHLSPEIDLTVIAFHREQYTT